MRKLYKIFKNFIEYSNIGGEINDRYVIKPFVPRWFNFLSWLFMLGGLLYIYQKTNSEIILAVFIFSLYILWRFLNSFLFINPYYELLLKKIRQIKKIGGILFFLVRSFAPLVIVSLLFYLILVTIQKLSSN